MRQALGKGGLVSGGGVLSRRAVYASPLPNPPREGEGIAAGFSATESALNAAEEKVSLFKLALSANTDGVPSPSRGGLGRGEDTPALDLEIRVVACGRVTRAAVFTKPSLLSFSLEHTP